MTVRLGVVRTVGRLAWVSGVTVVLLVILAVAVFPTRNFLEQRRAMAETRSELADLRAMNDVLRSQRDNLQTAAEIERIARTDFGMVFPGEEAYVIRGLDRAPIPVPEGWPLQSLENEIETAPADSN